MDDDFNTLLALSVLASCFHQANQHHASKSSDQAKQQALVGKDLASLLGLLQSDPESFLTQSLGEINTDWIDAMIEKHSNARAAKDYDTAESIRDTLLQKGIELDDTDKATV